MKKLFTILLISGSLILVAQPTLTTSSNMLAIGDKVYSNLADTTGILQGNSGANQTWNFSSLVATGSPLITNYISPAGTPYVSSFPNANLCAQAVSTGGVSSYQYYKTDATNLSFYGFGTPNYIYLLSDPMIGMQLPMTYNSSYTDNMVAHYYVNSTVVYRRGTFTSLVDGYGTLTTPSGTYQNVLRVKGIQNYNDSFVYSGTTLGVGTSVVTNYYWVSAITKSQLLSITFSNSIEMGSPSYAKSVMYYPGVVNGVSEQTSKNISLSIYPNPVNGTAKINFKLDESADVKYEITDITGKILIAETAGRMNVGVQEILVNCDELKTGMYFIKLLFNDQTASVSKFMVN